MLLVGARGFEPPTSRSQTERTTRLCYAPTKLLSAKSGGGPFYELEYERSTDGPSLAANQSFEKGAH